MIKDVYEIDFLVFLECHGQMAVIAYIDDFSEERLERQSHRTE